MLYTCVEEELTRAPDVAALGRELEPNGAQARTDRGVLERM